MTFRRYGITCGICLAMMLACTSTPAPRPNATTSPTMHVTRGSESPAPAVVAPRVAHTENVAPVPRPLDSIHVYGDQTISRRAAAAVAAMPIGANGVVINTDRGVVVLEGNVATEADRVAIENAVHTVRGVERIDDKLLVRE